MSAPRIAPTLRAVVAKMEGDRFEFWQTRRELRVLLAVARAAARDPYKHWRVERALSRLDAVSRPSPRRKRP